MGHEDDVVRELQDSVAQLKSLVETTQAKLDLAMPRDEYGGVDYHAHRKFHTEYNSSKKEALELKQQVLKNIFTWFAVGLLTILGSVLVDQYIRPLLKVISTTN